MTLFTLKLGLLIFWMLWQLIVFMTNLFEGLKLLRIVPPYWKFASQNYQAVEQATGVFQAPAWVPRLCFLGVLVWQLATLLLFVRAIVFTARHGEFPVAPVTEAFAASVGLLATFMIADEVLKQYDLERAHVLYFIAQLLTLLALHVLPA